MASSLSHPPTTLSSLLHKTSKSITTPQIPFLSTSNFTSSKLIKHLLYNKNRVVKGLIPRASVDVIDDPILEEDVKEEKARALRVGIVCGGPSAKRGISLNSARSVLDHIQGDDIDVRCYYIDCNLNAFAISSAQMYSNTPADFDFKVERILAPGFSLCPLHVSKQNRLFTSFCLCSLAQSFQSLSDFTEHLASSVDIVFPVIHGHFGEDAGIQELLEKANIPFFGTPSNECRRDFDKESCWANRGGICI